MAKIYNATPNSKYVKIVGICTIIGIVVITLITGLYTTSQTENALIINNLTGKIELDTKAGLSYTFPIINKVVKSPKVNTTFISSQDGNSKDNIQVNFSINVEYKQVDQVALYKKLGKIDTPNNNEVTKNYINTYLSNSVDTITNAKTYDEIKSNISAMSIEVTNSLKETLPTDAGIEIIKVVIDSVDAPENIETAIQNKIVKQQEMEASQFEVEKAKNEAEAQRIKQDSVSASQQQLEACIKAIEKGNASSPACYFGNGTYVNGSSGVAVQ